MTSEKIQRVGVIGAGIMGAGIAEVCARAHVDVLVFEQTRELAAAGRSRILRSLDRGVSSGKITEREREQAAWRLRFTSDLGDFADRQLVVEAVVEDEKIKSEIFAELDAVVTDPDAVLASNTSSIPIMKLAVATSRPSNVLGVHFFNPVPVLSLVELVPSLMTDEATTERARASNRPTVPSALSLELATNPFLRASDPDVQRNLGMQGAEPSQVFAEIRTRKDSF